MARKRLAGPAIRIDNGITKSAFYQEKPSCHAEFLALIKCIRYPRLSHCTLYVVRVSRGEFSNSRPCERCANFIRKVGIKVTYYSI